MTYQQGDQINVRLGTETIGATVLSTKAGHYRVKLEDGNTVTVRPQDIVAEPGTRAHNEALPAGFGLPERYTNEGIAELNEGRQEPMVEVVTDEWHKRVGAKVNPSTGAISYVDDSPWEGNVEQVNPFDEVAGPHIAANPGWEYRFLSPAMEKRRGRRDYQIVREPEGHPKAGQIAEAAGMPLGRIPKHVYEQRRKLVADESERALTNNREQTSETLARIARDTQGGVSPIDTSDSQRIFSSNKQ